jgi:hypothetical protein
LVVHVWVWTPVEVTILSDPSPPVLPLLFNWVARSVHPVAGVIDVKTTPGWSMPNTDTTSWFASAVAPAVDTVGEAAVPVMVPV